MKYTITFSILLFSLMFTSCKETKTAIEAQTSEIFSGEYEIKSMNGSELIRKLSFTLDVSENKIFGKTGCNTYSGSYTSTNNNEIKIGPLAATKMYCEENVMKVENDLFKAYSKTRTYSFDKTMLTLFSEDGSLLIRAYKLEKNNNED